MPQDWRALIAAERMELDGEFSDRVRASSLSSQQWSLVMTAVEFEVESPETPEDARMVANTDNLPAVASELDTVEAATPGASTHGGGGDGLLSRISDFFGSGGGGNDELLAEAEDLAGEYADRLQEKLVARGRWEAVCSHAAGG